MARLTIARVFEASKILATEAGQQIRELVTYSSEAFEQIVRALRNNLTFEDNFRCRVVTVSLTDAVFSDVFTGGGVATGVVPLQVQSQVVGVKDFTWFVTEAGQLRVRVGFTTPGTYSVKLLVLF